MSEIKMIVDGGSAFPVSEEEDPVNGSHTGMSLRDFFAAKIMPAMFMARSEKPANLEAAVDQCDALARACYMMADAMLRYRERNEP